MSGPQLGPGGLRNSVIMTVCVLAHVYLHMTQGAGVLTFPPVCRQTRCNDDPAT